MHFLRTCLMYVLLHVFACIFVCICMYVVFFLVISVCMCAYCLYVVHIGRLALLPAKNTGKYMQYNTDIIITQIYAHHMHNIYTHTCTYIHQKTSNTYKIRDIWIDICPVSCMYFVCMTLFKRRIHTSYMHIHDTYRIL